MTIQAPEILVYCGKAIPLLAEPLEPLLKALGNRPEVFCGLYSMNSGCWRGYVGTWEIIKDRFYLIGLEYPSGVPIALAEIFPACEDHIFASWFSGNLIASLEEMVIEPRGEMTTSIVPRPKPITSCNEYVLFQFHNGVLQYHNYYVAPDDMSALLKWRMH